MTVRLTQNIRVAGVVETAGAILNAAESVEQEWIQRGVAARVGRHVAAPGEEYVLSSPAESPAQNVAALQALLDIASARRTRAVVRPGLYVIDSPLYVDSNCELHLLPGALIRGIASNDKPLMVSRAWQRMRTAPVSVTLTWSSGTTFSVGWTNHAAAGLEVGSAVWLDGTSLQAYFKGVFVIESITDANTFVVRAKRLPLAAPSGDVVAVVATSNVSIVGGDWDYNYDGSFPTSELDRHIFVLGGVHNVWPLRVNLLNAAKFGIYWTAHLNCGFEDIRCDKTNSDGVKIYGPGYNFRGRGLAGITGDDAVSMQTREPPTYANYQPYFGDLIDCEVSDISCVAATSVAVFYSRRVADGIMDNCWFRNVGGAAPNGVRFINQSSIDAETVERSFIEIGAENVQVAGTYAVKGEICMAESVKLFNIYPCPNKNSPVAHVLFVANCDCRSITMRDPLVVSPAWSTSGGAFIESTATCDLMRIENATSKVNGSINPRLLQLQAAAQTREVVIVGSNSDADALVDTYATNNPTITVSHSRHGGAAVISVRASCQLNFAGNDFTNASNGVVRYNATATVTLRSDGTNRLRAGSWVAAPTGTPTLNVYGWDINIDPATVPGASSTAGQFCWSTQAGAEGGPAVRGPSAWYALAAGTSGANGEIA